MGQEVWGKDKEMKEDVKLPDLPPSDDEYWQYSERELTDMKKKARSHEHHFVQKAGREIQCACGFGLYIGVGDKIKDGHLYHNGELIA